MIVAYGGVITFLYIPKGVITFKFRQRGSCVFVRCFAGSYGPPPVEIMNGPLGHNLIDTPIAKTTVFAIRSYTR